jgi:ribosomal protein L22
MSTPGDPSQGKPAEDEQAEQASQESAAAASESAAEQSAEATRSAGEAGPGGERSETDDVPGPSQDEPAPSQAEGTAAETTGVDKAGAEAAAVIEPLGDAEPAAEPEPEPEASDRASRRRRGERGPKEATPAATAPAPTRRRDRKRSGEGIIVRAQARYVRSSARKARLVADGVRGKSVTEARAALAFHPRAVSEAWTKLLESAVANAENNHDLVGEDLKIHAIWADEGPTIKRFRPRAMGRATPIRKRTSHLTIQLTPRD